MSHLPVPDAGAVERLWMEYGAAVAGRDPAAIANLFTPDGDMVAVDGTHVAGADDIAAYYRRQFAGAFQQASIQDVELAPPCPLGADSALMNATWMVHGLEAAPFRVRTTLVATREETRWRLAAVRFAAARQPAQQPGEAP
jgi:uncharacterized protein (TIGR02246 family)